LARNKVVAYADDKLIATSGDSIRALENYAIAEMSKVTDWSKKNKMIFNDEETKAMLVTKRKRREDKDIKIYLHFKPIEHFIQMKYLGLTLDKKFKF